MDLWQRQGQDGQVQLDVEARAVFTMAENQALVETIQQALLSSLETPASDKFEANPPPATREGTGDRTDGGWDD